MISTIPHVSGHRRRVVMGKLTLADVPEDQVEECKKWSFNPWLLVEGIEPSYDPVLRVR
jgi:catalase